MNSFGIKPGKLIGSLIITLAVGGIAGYATATSIGSWYVTLNKPWFNPPNALFGPVWTVLYIMMGIALYRVWRSPSTSVRNAALRWFALQLALNFAWSFLFFYFHHIGVALLDISVLLITIILTIVGFAKVDKSAAWLLFPYVCWVSFATILNAAIFSLNR